MNDTVRNDAEGTRRETGVEIDIEIETGTGMRIDLRVDMSEDIGQEKEEMTIIEMKSRIVGGMNAKTEMGHDMRESILRRTVHKKRETGGMMVLEKTETCDPQSETKSDAHITKSRDSI
jgi:hypothetical protein